MTTGATGQLGLALPVQGELSGSWGNTVNNAITEYTNIAIAATLTLTNDGAVTLANTTGTDLASNIVSSLTGAGTVTAQFAIVRVTGTLTTAKVVTAPSYSKTYTVVNAATGGIVTFKASGQTGVSIAVGESAFVYYNGTDYVKVSSTVATGVTSFTAGTTGFTPSTATTGAVTLAGTLATTNGGTGLTSFTSGGVVYASSTSALATGSALTFDGTKLTIGSTTANAKFNVNTTTYTAVTNGEQVLIEGTGAWQQGLAFSMWSAGLYNSNYASGYIGVPNTTNELFISGGAAVVNNIATGGWAKALNTTSASFMVVGGGNTTFYGNTGLTANTTYTPTELLRLTSTSLYTASGINVGIGTTSPSDKLTVVGSINLPTVNSYIRGGGHDVIQVDATRTYFYGGTSGIQMRSSNNALALFEMSDAGVFTFSPSGTERARIQTGFSVGTTADPGAGAIYATGNITAFFSDKRLKTVSGKIENALDKVAQLSGVYYTFNDTAKSFGYDSDEEHVGVLAQDVEAVLPQIVKAAPFDLDENNNSKSGENYKTVQYEKLVPLLIEAINELQAKVKLLENK